MSVCQHHTLVHVGYTVFVSNLDQQQVEVQWKTSSAMCIWQTDDTVTQVK